MFFHRDVFSKNHSHIHLKASSIISTRPSLLKCSLGKEEAGLWLRAGARGDALLLWPVLLRCVQVITNVREKALLFQGKYPCLFCPVEINLFLVCLA